MKLEPDRVAGGDPDPGNPRAVSPVSAIERSGESVGVPVETIECVEQVRTHGTKTVVEPSQGVEYPLIPRLIAVVVARHRVVPGRPDLPVRDHFKEALC